MYAFTGNGEHQPATRNETTPKDRFINGGSVYCAGVVPFNLRRRNSIAKSAAMVRMSLVTCVRRTLLYVAGVSVGSSRSRTCFEGEAELAPESNCLMASIVAKRCAVVSFIASRLL